MNPSVPGANRSKSSSVDFCSQRFAKFSIEGSTNVADESGEMNLHLFNASSLKRSQYSFSLFCSNLINVAPALLRPKNRFIFSPAALVSVCVFFPRMLSHGGRSKRSRCLERRISSWPRFADRVPEGTCCHDSRHFV